MKQPTHVVAPQQQTLRALGLLLLAATGWAVALPAKAQASTEPPAAMPYSLSLGLAVARLPEYEGSDRFETRALPLISYRSGRFFAGTLSGVGYNLSNTPAVEFGPVLSYRFGRDESDSPEPIWAPSCGGTHNHSHWAPGWNAAWAATSRAHRCAWTPATPWP
jgi:hypothetical protein